MLRRWSIVMSYTYANLPIEQVRPNAKNTRTHSKKQIRQIATSIRELGFAAPVLVDEYDVLIAGHGRLEAARSLGMASIPAIILDGLSEAKKRALMLVPVVNQIRTYWWCSPPRTGRQRMVPASLTARETGASFSKDKCVLISL